jgi:hypothetical protein
MAINGCYLKISMETRDRGTCKKFAVALESEGFKLCATRWRNKLSQKTKIGTAMAVPQSVHKVNRPQSFVQVAVRLNFSPPAA